MFNILQFIYPNYKDNLKLLLYIPKIYYTPILQLCKEYNKTYYSDLSEDLKEICELGIFEYNKKYLLSFLNNPKNPNCELRDYLNIICLHRSYLVINLSKLSRLYNTILIKDINDIQLDIPGYSHIVII